MHRAPDPPEAAFGFPLLLWLLPWAPCLGDCPRARGAAGGNETLAVPAARPESRRRDSELGGETTGAGAA
jgi:hypothetical protein